MKKIFLLLTLCTSSLYTFNICTLRPFLLPKIRPVTVKFPIVDGKISLLKGNLLVPIKPQQVFTNQKLSLKEANYTQSLGKPLINIGFNTIAALYAGAILITVIAYSEKHNICLSQAVEKIINPNILLLS